MKHFINKFICIILSLTFLFSCSQKKEKSEISKLEVSVAGLSDGGLFSGGIMIWGKSDSGEVFALSLIDENDIKNISLATGNWSFKAIGWLGTGPLEGEIKCGLTTKDLVEEEETIDMTLSAINCNDADLSDLNYNSDNKFLPIKLISCNDITGLSLGANCDSSAKGFIRSYRIHLNDLPEIGPIPLGLTSLCIDEDNSASSITATNYHIPVGLIDDDLFNTSIEAFSSLGCIGDSIHFDFSNGLINGNPNSLVFDNGDFTEVFLEASMPAPEISYSVDSFIYNENTSVPVTIPINTGGDVLSYSITPGLPSGLTLNSSTGEISGTPTGIFANSNFTITASGIGGISIDNIDIMVSAEAPNLTSYNTVAATYFQGVIITANSPTTSGGGTVLSWSISPALPSGLSFSTSTGIISGTPSVTSASSIYTVSAINSGGSSNFNIDIQIITVATLTISDASTYDYGTVASGAVVDHTFTVSHSGGPATGISEVGLNPPFSFKGSSFPGTGGTCVDPISSDCIIVISYSPTDTSGHSDVIDLNYSDGVAVISALRNIQGTGANPAVLLISETDPYDYQTNIVGSNNTHNFTVTNSGGISATGISGSGLASPFSFLGSTYPGSGGTCGTSLVGGASCIIVVSYDPSGSGAHNDSIEINYSDGASGQLVIRGIQGTGNTPALLTITEAPKHDFGIHPVGGSVPTKLLTVTNSGETSATSIGSSLSTFSFTGAAFPGTAGNCGSSLAAAGSCSIEVELPLGSSGSYTENMAINYEDGVTSQNSVIELRGIVGNLDHVVTGESHSCVLFDSGHVKCWGKGSSGVLGYEDAISRGASGGQMGTNLSIVDMGAGVIVSKIAAGANHNCVVMNDGKVKCWGDNSLGQLGLEDSNTRGDNASEMGDLLPFVSLGTGRTATDIVAGSDFTCAILDNASVKCWGGNSFGQLGQGDTSDRGASVSSMGDVLGVVNLGSGRTAIKLAAGKLHVCAILDNNDLKCWGKGAFGALGSGSSSNVGDAPGMGALPPVDVGGGNHAVKISAGKDHTCAILNDNSLKCWGKGTDGQLGNESTSGAGVTGPSMGSALLPVNLGGGSPSQITASAYGNCILFVDNTLRCWGKNDLGQLGLEHTSTIGDDASEMGSNLLVTSLASTPLPTVLSTGGLNDHYCSIFNDNSLRCWGQNNFGQLGLGDINNRGDTASEMGTSLPDVVVY